MTEIQIPDLPDYSEDTIQQATGHLLKLLREDVAQAKTVSELEPYRVRWIGRKAGLLKQISENWLPKCPPESRRDLGQAFNALKQQVEIELDPRKLIERGIPATLIEDFKDGPRSSNQKVSGGIDITLPGTQRAPGVPHPLLKTMHEIVHVFHHLGYSTNLGPQVESDFYNFEALNFPPNHPARDTQDTLVIAAQQTRPSRDRLLMRTHTSPVQIRTMIAQAPPIRIVIPGKVHRNDAADATHSPIFHQIEGLCVDTNITFSDLKGTLDHAMKALFGSDVKTRFFPSFFPFTEPSADVQISCIFCGGKGCRKCKHSGWIELLGCGMVDPAVFAAVTEERRKLDPSDDAYNPEKIAGFAFGMGVERIAMMLHGVSDIGHFYSGDMRFLEQFA
jgi:phenylalanyl-tRNA synthetase alpha chain